MSEACTDYPALSLLFSVSLQSESISKTGSWSGWVTLNKIPVLSNSCHCHVLTFGSLIMAVKSLKTLKSILEKRICQNGRLSVPNEKIQDTIFTQGPKLNKISFYQMQKSNKDQVKNFMRDHFYTSALVPNSIQLRDTWPAFPYLEDELDLMLDSNTSYISCDENGQLMGAILNTLWTFDPDYDTFEVDPVDWLNVAWDLAKQSSQDPLYRVVIWRDFQFQLIYHIVQVKASKSGASVILYGGMGYQKPEARAQGFIPVFLSAGNDWAKSQPDALFTFMGTFPGFQKLMQKNVPGMFETIAYMPYNKLEFQAFESLKDGMIIMSSK